MPKRNPKYMADRRERILDAAQLCLFRAGTDRFTIEEICREAGISTGALYRHFPTKRDIFLGLMERSVSQRDHVEIADFSMLENFLVEVIRGYDSPGGAEIARTNFHLLQMSLADPELLAKAQDSFIGLENFLERCLRRIAPREKSPRSIDIDRAAKTLASLVRGIWLAKVVDPNRAAENYVYCIRSEIERLR